MFDKQIMRKYVIIVLCVIAILVAIMFIRRTFSRYESQANSDIEADLAFCVVGSSIQSDEIVCLGNIVSGDYIDYYFTVSNFNESVESKVPIEYGIVLDVTTNMPLKYKIFVVENGTELLFDKTEEKIYQDEDGTFYKQIRADGFRLGLVNEKVPKETDTYMIRVEFPTYDQDGINDGTENDENWMFADMVEAIQITIDARQEVKPDIPAAIIQGNTTKNENIVVE